MNQKAIEFVREFEGVRLDVYLDSAGLKTVGVGHLITGADELKIGDRITQEQADAFLARDLQHAADAVAAFVRVLLSEDQEAALISFTFNLGSNALKTSTLLRKLNAGDYAGASLEFAKWTHAGGRVVNGLVRRREAERALFTGES